jgi:hypothetical protein
MEDMFSRVGEQLIDREHGPLTFRLVVQPLVATVLAIRSGLRDARAGRPAYFWTAAWDPAQRLSLIQEGWKDVGRLFLLAVVLDVIYQVIVFHWVYVGELFIVATLLAVLPYLVLRSLTDRLMRRIRPKKPPE